jgi:hypothetical protein
MYSALFDDREEIERSLGVPIKWQSDGVKHSIISANNYSGALLDDHAEELYEMMADRVNRFVSVFRPRLSKLVDASN